MLLGTLILSASLVGATAQPRAEDVARLANEGWMAAREAALKGGSAESIAPARQALAELDKLMAGTTLRLQGEYAHALIAAAIAAAQDERAEMEIHLAQARDLSIRLRTSMHPARWPLGIDEAAGELWLEVEEYAEAAEAFQRAIAMNPTGVSYLGLARSAARLGNAAIACESYRHVIALFQGTIVSEAKEYLQRCP